MYGKVARTFDGEIHTRYVENITGQHPKKMFSMFKSETYHKGVLYSCERICINHVNGLVCKRSNQQEPKLVGFNIKAEDPRLIVINDQVYIVFNHARTNNLFPRCMGISEFNNWKPVTLEIKGAPEDIRKRTEKNWTPFIKDNILHFVYNFDPLIILTYNFNKQGECSIVYPSNNVLLNNTEETFIRGGSNLIDYKDNLLIGACHSRITDKIITAYHTHIVILDKSCFKIIYLSKPVAFRHEKQELFIGQGPYHWNEWYKIKFVREILFPLGKLPVSNNTNMITTPCSIYEMNNKIYMTVNIQDSMTFRYEIYLGRLDLERYQNSPPNNLNLFSKNSVESIIDLIPTKVQQKPTKVCRFA